MSNFVAIKGMDIGVREDIMDALAFIKKKITKGAVKEVVPTFNTWYGNFITIIQAHDLYEIIGMSAEQLEQQRIFVEKFESTFAEKFLSLGYDRKRVSRVRDRFKRFSDIGCDVELYLGTVKNVNDITTIFTMFREYANFIVNLYDDAYKKLDYHLTKEGIVLQNFLETTKIKGKVVYYPMIDDIRLTHIPFGNELLQCQTVLPAIDAWFNLRPFGTNIPSDDLTDEASMLVIITDSGERQLLSLKDELVKIVQGPDSVGDVSVYIQDASLIQDGLSDDVPPYERPDWEK